MQTPLPKTQRDVSSKQEAKPKLRIPNTKFRLGVMGSHVKIIKPTEKSGDCVFGT
jgi:hypothetical protein